MARALFALYSAAGMCYFITLVFPNGTDLDDVRFAAGDDVRRALGLALLSIENKSLRRYLQPDDLSVLRSGGGAACDCGTALGSVRRASRHKTDDDHQSANRIYQKAEKLRRDGWSDAKVERWIAQKQAAAARPQEGVAGLSDWELLLSRVLDSGAAPRIGLVLHWYTGLIEDEPISLERTTVKRNDITLDLLADIDEDVLYEFVR
jgi:hypothetical protein